MDLLLILSEPIGVNDALNGKMQVVGIHLCFILTVGTLVLSFQKNCHFVFLTVAVPKLLISLISHLEQE